MFSIDHQKRHFELFTHSLLHGIDRLEGAYVLIINIPRFNYVLQSCKKKITSKTFSKSSKLSQ